MLFDTPPYSQYLDVSSKRWQDRACGIIALKSVMEYWRAGKIYETRALIREGLRHHAYLRGRGWKHAGLARIARHYGFAAHTEDRSHTPFPLAFRYLRQDLRRGPVLISIWKNFSPASRSGHLVVLCGIRKHRFIIVDPASRTRHGIRRSVSRRTFARGWKKRYIVVLPRYSRNNR